MKRHLIIGLFLLVNSFMASAQKEYRLAKSNGHLRLNVIGAIVEGYDGKEIIFSNQNANKDYVDTRAKGLVAVNTSGYTDNTGLGFSIVANGQDINVNHVSANSTDILTIKVPNGIKISINNNNNKFYEDFIIRNIIGEIEVATNFNKIRLDNNSGPINVSTINGAVEATFGRDIKGPISIVSIYDFVDVTLPSTIKANLEMVTFYGKLYAASEFKIVPDKIEMNKGNAQGPSTSSDNKNQINRNTKSNSGPLLTGGYLGFGNENSGEKLKGKLNGGGIDLIIRSNNSNIYLRTK
ncbi:hypothetical protein [Pedobacter agri]|uniref:hypothetical protein n=1 Tax=Pedobacter agri TaxID=454586 RepID=UPI00292F66CA|nr:hypothetical protein [Pedobacter agri]